MGKPWTDSDLNELCDFLADGPNDREAFKRASVALGRDEEFLRSRFADLTFTHEQFFRKDLGWRP